MIEQPVGAALNRDIGFIKGEQVDGELGNLIERRHNQRIRDEGERAVEAVWKEAERREEAQRQREWQQGRLAVCEHLQNVYMKLADEHGEEARKLRGKQPEGA